jgi:hypothetical protein
LIKIGLTELRYGDIDKLRLTVQAELNWKAQLLLVIRRNPTTICTSEVRHNVRAATEYYQVHLLADVAEWILEFFNSRVVGGTFWDDEFCVFNTFEFFFAVSYGLLYHALLIVIQGVEFEACSLRTNSLLPRLHGRLCSNVSINTAFNGEEKI